LKGLLRTIPWALLSRYFSSSRIGETQRSEVSPEHGRALYFRAVPHDSVVCVARAQPNSDSVWRMLSSPQGSVSAHSEGLVPCDLSGV
jgi:hypothetical protein